MLDYAVNSPEVEVKIDYSRQTIYVDFPENYKIADNLVAEYSLSEGAKAYVGGVLQESGVSQNSYEKSFNFKVLSEDEKVKSIWSVQPSNNGYTAKWGMGGFLKQEVSLNRNYDWYINQAETGIFSDVNCAPTSVVMVARWLDKDFPHSVEDAREMYNPEGGGWYTQDIQNCLLDYEIDHTVIDLATSTEETTGIIQVQLDEGNILMVCIDIHYLRLCENDSVRVDKYYETIALGTGHCIVVKGYKLVNGAVFFEIYDPAGYNFRYNDGQSKGKDRYYRGDDVFTATFGSWNHAFVIAGSGKSFTGKQRLLKSAGIPNILIL